MKPFSVIVLAVKDWWRDWVNLSAFTIGWVLCWATVVLGPPATFILYAIVHEHVRGRSFHLAELPTLFRRYFFESWLWALLNLLVAGGIWLNFGYYSRIGGAWGAALLVFTAIVAAAWLTVQFYTLPYLMHQSRLRLVAAFRNALLTTLASPVYTLVLNVFTLLVVLVMVRFFFLVFLGLPALVAVLGAHAVAERLRAFGK